MKMPAGRKQSLKTRITGISILLISLILIVVSVTVFTEWRSLIIQNREKYVLAVTHAFAAPVTDAVITAQNEKGNPAGVLDIFIQRFMKQVDYIKYIEIFTPEGELIAGSSLTDYSKTITTDSLNNSINLYTYEHGGFGWITEVTYPLQIGNKVWGILNIAYDVNPVRQEIRGIFLILFFSTVLLIFLSFFIINFFIKRITASLERLVNFIETIDWNNDETPVFPETADEVGVLIHHFRLLRNKLADNRKQLISAQQQIYRAEKLASIGRLASGIAHEINNPLNGIKSCIYGIRNDPDNPEQLREYLELIGEGIDHMESVVQKLLGFARQKSKSMEPVNINEAVNKVIHLLNYRLKQKNMEINTVLDDKLPLIEADYHLIQEVIMNLLLNSYDAVKEGGKVIITTGTENNDHIFITVKDTGEGIPEEAMNKIFDPFYTTKDVGEGTGLGLSVSLGIIESHGGSITVKSIPGKETVFKIILPIKGEL